MKLKLLFLTIILGLTSCNRSQMISSADNTAEPEVIAVDETDEPETPDAPSTPETQKVFMAEDVATYFNDKGEEEGIAVAYVESEGHWYLHYIGEESADESRENLSLGISSFLKYIPLYKVYEGGYLFTKLSKYIEDPETYFVYVAVSSNWFAAASMYSYIEDNHLITDIIVYDGRNGLYEEK